jgi:hypothetical protein
MDAAGKRIFVLTLKINLYQLIVFENGYSRLMAIGSNHQFLTHVSPPLGP